MTLLQIQQVQKTSGSNVLIPHIDLDIDSGQCVVIQCNHELGGRLIECILGQLPISEGAIFIQGIEIQAGNIEELRNKIGLQLLSNAAYDRLKVSEYLQFFARMYEVRFDLEQLLARLGLAEKKNSAVSKLTLSEQRRLQIARALVHKPQLLILEDPEQNVDLETSYIIRNLIPTLTQEGMAILITTMVLEQAITLTNDVYLYSHAGLKKLDTIQEPINEKGNEPELASDAPTEELKKEQSEVELARTQMQLTEKKTASANESIVQEEGDRTPAFIRPVRLEKIPAKVGDKLILFDPMEIDYIESSEGVSNLHVMQGTYPCSFSLTVLEEKLKAVGFFRCHRSYLVNLQKVREVITWTRNSYSLILDDTKKSSIPLSKGKYDELKQILGI